MPRKESTGVHGFGPGLGSAWAPCLGTCITQGNAALGPADAELHKISCGKGKLLTSFLLAVKLPFCLLVPLRGPKV